MNADLVLLTATAYILLMTHSSVIMYSDEDVMKALTSSMLLSLTLFISE